MTSRKANRQKGQPKTPGSGRAPVPPQTRRRIVELARGGMGRNAIAREVGLSAGVVSRIVKADAPDHTWTREALKLQTEAKVADMKARRAELAEGLLDDVARIRGMLFADMERSHYSVALGHQRYQTAPTPDELRNLLTAIGIGLDKHAMLVRFDADDRDMPAVDRWLAGLGVAGTVVAA